MWFDDNVMWWAGWVGVFAGTLKDSKDVGFAILEILDGKNLEPKDRCGNAIHLQGCPKHSIKDKMQSRDTQRETEREKRREEKRLMGF